jgi:AraC-like DNA-binding protein
MTIIKKMLSTEMLPKSLGERQRFLRFAELLEHFSNTAELHPASGVPFLAEMSSVGIGTTVLGRCEGTFTTIQRDRRQVLATNDDRYCLGRNTGTRAAVVMHRGREFTLRPGAIVLLKLDEPFLTTDGASHKRFTSMNLPAAALRSMVPYVDEMVARELEPGGALSLALDYCNLLLDHPTAADEAGTVIAQHLLDLAALGLGADDDQALAVLHGGLRAVRLRAVLTILEQRFSRSDFSAQKLATATGLSERYVNELLYDAGASFTTRLNELRLGKAARLLAMTDNRISDIASECGFNDLSYFNRSFHRRFGLTPTAARGK